MSGTPQKFYTGRAWFFYWAHLDSNDDPVADFSTNTYYVTLQNNYAAVGDDPLVRLEGTKDAENGELYAELTAAQTESYVPGTYVLYYEIIDSAGRLIGLQDREITVESAPSWED